MVKRGGVFGTCQKMIGLLLVTVSAKQKKNVLHTFSCGVKLMAKKKTVWQQLDFTNRNYLDNLKGHLDEFYSHYSSIAYDGTNKNAVASDLKDIKCVCSSMIDSCNELIKSLGLDGQF